ncbi:MAG: UDP-N-acetylmuramoyl-L-alanine--D-glutamate ligase [Acidobacteria bacterium]|nr:UDP-N-acetylmuramoyl-L-alanine--D-glutamate ligase [Acidobacteriota bacterium]
MTRFSVRGQQAVVVGGARSGVAAARLLVERGASVTLTDLRDTIADASSLAGAGVRLVLGSHPLDLFTSADLIVVSPGVPRTQEAIVAARERGVPIIGEVELASRWIRGRVVAITGTKGKSTTTALTGRILEQAGCHVLVGGNIGTPLSGQVGESTPASIHVVEVSSFQLETVDTFHPWIAALLNLTTDHLDRHANFLEYTDAKARIFVRQTEQDWAVVNADDPQTLELARRGRARRRQFGLQGGATADVTVADGIVVERTDTGDMPLVRTSDVRLIGPHLMADVLAAAAITRLAGALPKHIAAAVSAFRGLEHVMEWVDEIDGVRYVNDSKATNIDAAMHAINTFGAGLVVVMGGRYKGGDFGSLREALVARRASVVAIGEARPLIRDALGPAVPVVEAASMAEAVGEARRAGTRGGTVLLAPGCASLDMFADYAARGRAFKAEVARLRTR